MRRATILGLSVALVAVACKSSPDYSRSLPPGAPALIPLAEGEPVPDFSGDWEQRDEIEIALTQSLAWMRRPHAKGFFPAAGIGYDRALRSLERFAELLEDTHEPREFQEAVEREFTVYKAAGWDGRGGGVLFTAYCTPILHGSLEPSPRHRYPLYGLPEDLVKGSQGQILGWDTAIGRLPSYPSRGAIEAGILANKGLELVWLDDPIDAYVAHVNGSAFIQLTDGSMLRLGYAGKNGRSYTSLGKELEADGLIPRGRASLASIREWAARASEDELADYLHRNQSFVFFTPIESNPHGSLDVPVTAERSLATDKTLFPRASICFVDTQVMGDTGTSEPFRAFLFDQDTGGAIQSAGRADIYLGIGPDAVRRAGATKGEGQLYYLFLKE